LADLKEVSLSHDDDLLWARVSSERYAGKFLEADSKYPPLLSKPGGVRYLVRLGTSSWHLPEPGIMIVWQLSN